jgi:hypothetical protein
MYASHIRDRTSMRSDGSPSSSNCRGNPEIALSWNPSQRTGPRLTHFQMPGLASRPIEKRYRFQSMLSSLPGIDASPELPRVRRLSSLPVDRLPFTPQQRSRLADVTPIVSDGSRPIAISRRDRSGLDMRWPA